jgi:hypothetical protein
MQCATKIAAGEFSAADGANRPSELN